MLFRKFEIFIALVLGLLSFCGYYYLGDRIPGQKSNHSLIWYTADILWLFAILILGYRGLIAHELKWAKHAWLVIYSILLILVLVNKLIEHYLHKPTFLETAGTLIRSPFLFLAVAFLSRWINTNKSSKTI